MLQSPTPNPQLPSPALKALWLEHAQEDASVRAEATELLGVVQAESGQSLKTSGDGDNQLIRIARRDFSCRLSIDDQLPKLA